jgi:hypothetical protein
MTFLYGICYGPARSTDTYCKDWFTTEYQDRWGSGSGRRGDLATLKALGFNLVRSYYWDSNNDHNAFLTEAERVGIGVEVPIANSYVSSRNTAAAKKLVDATKGRSCVKLYCVGNEMSPSETANIAYMVGYLRSLGVAQPITHTSIFDNNFATAKSVINAISNRSGYIAGVNTYFFCNPVQQHGDCITGAVNQWARDPATQGVPLYIGEWGCSNAVSNNTTSINNQLAAIQRLKTSQPRLVGASLFEYSCEPWKLSAGGEDKYGIIDSNGNKLPPFSIVQSYAGKI